MPHVLLLDGGDDLGDADSVLIELSIDEARNLVYDPSTSGVLVDMCDKIKDELKEAGRW